MSTTPFKSSGVVNKENIKKYMARKPNMRFIPANIAVFRKKQSVDLLHQNDLYVFFGDLPNEEEIWEKYTLVGINTDAVGVSLSANETILQYQSGIGVANAFYHKILTGKHSCRNNPESVLYNLCYWRRLSHTVECGKNLYPEGTVALSSERSDAMDAVKEELAALFNPDVAGKPKEVIRDVGNTNEYFVVELQTKL